MKTVEIPATKLSKQYGEHCENIKENVIASDHYDIDYLAASCKLFHDQKSFS